jgi:hypothetical protein
MWLDISLLNKSKIKKLKPKLVFLCLSIIFLSTGCNKVELKNAVIKGRVMHHEWEVAGVKVYLKKNVTEFPGYNTALYDDSTKAISSVRFEAPFAFRGLEAGDYYVYVYGFDTLFNMPVRGAQFYQISDNLEIVNTDVIVSE